MDNGERRRLAIALRRYKRSQQARARLSRRVVEEGINLELTLGAGGINNNPLAVATRAPRSSNVNINDPVFNIPHLPSSDESVASSGDSARLVEQPTPMDFEHGIEDYMIVENFRALDCSDHDGHDGDGDSHSSSTKADLKRKFIMMVAPPPIVGGSSSATQMPQHDALGNRVVPLIISPEANQFQHQQTMGNDQGWMLPSMQLVGVGPTSFPAIANATEKGKGVAVGGDGIARTDVGLTSKKPESIKFTMQGDEAHELVKTMPTVTTTGGVPDGRLVKGVLYDYKQGNVCIVCTCHGTFYTPEGFVRHAGGNEVVNPLMHIKVTNAVRDR